MPLYEMPMIWEMGRGDPVTAAEHSAAMNLPQVLELPSGGILAPQDPQDRRTGHFLRDLFTRRHHLQAQEGMMSGGPCACHKQGHAPPYGQPQTYRPQPQSPHQQAL